MKNSEVEGVNTLYCSRKGETEQSLDSQRGEKAYGDTGQSGLYLYSTSLKSES